ncbi:MarR family winged helix-turn-helix transcriptional regulator [Petroclostridium xylanilyticum]|uniref:MarR family winged helix-turn-helix transcriptional regulator n=1 Tax=Petroclostridium xylanilyticum TaxID=1792311 RepID=UPI000B987A97|nr:MarR family transcriptional regulator [Petroclostridium xylanilyticum]
MNKLKKLAESYDWVDEIANKTIIELKKTADILEEVHSSFFNKFNISHTKFNVLVILYKNSEEGMTLSDIGEQMLVTKANITGLIDRLEKQGFVKRIRDSVDRRKITAVITEKGKQFTEEIIIKYKEWSRDIMTILNDHEKNQILHILRKLQQGLIDIAQ